jgi:NTP pyrophosphatase (non-canonical NTP hydrolase)
MENESQLKTLTENARAVIQCYKKEFPHVKIDEDYIPFKITEEWGECIQAYLMLTDRGRKKGMTREEIHARVSDECADVFAYLLVFAADHDIDLANAFEKKWMQYLKKS